MNVIKQWVFAWRLLVREARSGELTLIAIAVVLAVTSATAIALLSARLDLAMEQRAHELLGADVRLESTLPLTSEWADHADSLGLRSTQTIHFPSMIMFGDDMAMASVKAVADGYPLTGELGVSDPDNAEAVLAKTSGPAVGEVWIEPRLAALLNAQLGDELEVGRSRLRLTGLLVKESDRSAGFYSFSPRLMMHSDDLAETGLITSGSRVRWRLLLTGDAEALAQFQMQPISAQQTFQTLENSHQTLAERLHSAQRYLGLASMLAVVLACAAVAISAQHYAQRNFNVSALMRTFGLSRFQVLSIYTGQLVQLGSVATLLGLAFAYGVHRVLVQLLADILPAHLPQAPVSAWLLGGSTGLLSLLGFALPHLLPLARVSPLKVLRRELAPVPMSDWLLSFIAVLMLALLLWLFTGDPSLTAMTLVGIGLAVCVMFFILYAVLSFLERLWHGKTLPLKVRFVWQHITHRKGQSIGQVLAFSLALMIMVLIASLRSDLLADWQQQLPVNAPNVFAINVQSYEMESFQSDLQRFSIEPQKLYATLPSRLVSINQQPIHTLAIANDASVNRDLIVTAESELSEGNQIVAGQWHGTTVAKSVSVEDKLAERLGIRLGDSLTFNFAGTDVSVEVKSLRQVDWSRMTPNFFMIFSPDVLKDQPITWMTSIHVSAAQQHALTELIRTYPAVTFFDTRPILEQLQTLLEQVTLAIEWILIFVLLAAILVLLASLVAGLSERLHEGAIIRALGGSRSLLRQAHWLEFSILGVSSAVLALLGAEGLRVVLYVYVLNLTWSGLGVWWLCLPGVAVLLFALPSLMLLRHTVNVPPLNVLRG